MDFQSTPALVGNQRAYAGETLADTTVARREAIPAILRQFSPGDLEKLAVLADANVRSVIAAGKIPVGEVLAMELKYALTEEPFICRHLFGDHGGSLDSEENRALLRRLQGLSPEEGRALGLVIVACDQGLSLP